MAKGDSVVLTSLTVVAVVLCVDLCISVFFSDADSRIRDGRVPDHFLNSVSIIFSILEC